MTNTIPYIISTLSAGVALLAQFGTNVPSWAPVGLTGIIALILMKFFPMMLDKMEKRNQAHEETIRHIVSKHDKREERWQELFRQDRICPILDNNHRINKDKG
jgi:Na+/H+ antiporter NhaC